MDKVRQTLETGRAADSKKKASEEANPTDRGKKKGARKEILATVLADGWLSEPIPG
ncbi:MAG: hypothetical protein OS130_08375 [Thermodesulfobacteriota bacterium]|jgi:hypothetical protein|nr:MAG: hypothetical protein OS130_08375 [Thermodesulfobacteriota bacterium]